LGDQAAVRHLEIAAGGGQNQHVVAVQKLGEDADGIFETRLVLPIY
jgi:hypothetical protein